MEMGWYFDTGILTNQQMWEQQWIWPLLIKSPCKFNSQKIKKKKQLAGVLYENTTFINIETFETICKTKYVKLV